jgi:hypothetical protein
MVMSELISVRTFRDRPEAEVAKAKLASAGIEAVVSADDAGGWQPGQPFVRGVRLLVDPRDLAAAIQLLRSTPE